MGNSKDISYVGLGIKRTNEGRALDVSFPLIDWADHSFVSGLIDLILGSERLTGSAKPSGGFPLTANLVDEISSRLESDSSLETRAKLHLREFLNSIKLVKSESSEVSYSQKEFIFFTIDDLSKDIDSIEEAYFKLYLISSRKVKPHAVNLTNIFKVLPNIAWSNFGPIFPEDLPRFKLKQLHLEIRVSHVDKFPYLVDCYIPQGVRIVSGSQVRLGAYLGEGTTVMPAGYVNFNAGTLGASMVEGRISAGVVVGKDSDLGGGASVMGTLSGGNDIVISIGERCLIGANAGTGISLGQGCTIAAGVYVTAASKVRVYNIDKQPINSKGEIVAEGENLVKAISLSGQDNLLFISDSSTGELKCFPNKKTIELNQDLHVNN